MNETLQLFAVVAGLYGLECVAWVKRRGVAFLGVGGRWRLRFASRFVGNSEEGVLLSPPWNPGALLLLVPGPRLGASPWGVEPGVPIAFEPATPPRRAAGWLAWSEIGDLRSNEEDLRLDGRRWLRTPDPTSARETLVWLVSTAARRQRARAAAELIDRSLSPGAANQRLDEFRERTASLLRSCWVLFAYLFVAVPAVVAGYSLVRTWHWLLAGLALLWLPCALRYWRLHRQLYPQESSERWTRLVTMTLLPQTAIRARDFLARPLLRDLDPALVAAALLREDATEWLGSVGRDLQHPRRQPQVDPDCQRHRRWYRRIYRRRLQAALAGGPIAEALTPKPPPPTAGCRSYCPRCHQQFVPTTATCDECELPTTAFPE